MSGAGTLDGGVAQRVDAEGGTLTAVGLTKTGAGDLTLAGATPLDLNATVDVDAGNLVIEDAFTAAGDLLASGDVTLSGAGTFDGAATQRVEATGGLLAAAATLTKGGAGGDLELAAGGPGAPITLAAGADVNSAGGALVLANAFTLSGGDLEADGDVRFTGGGTSTFSGADPQRVSAGTGAAGSILDPGGMLLAKANGDLVLSARDDIGASGTPLLVDIDSAAGGVRLVTLTNGSAVFLSSPESLRIDGIDTAVGTDFLDIRTSGVGKALVFDGSDGYSAGVANDQLVLVASGDLRFQATALGVDRIDARFGQDDAGATFSSAVVLTGAPAPGFIAVGGGEGADTFDVLADLDAQFVTLNGFGGDDTFNIAVAVDDGAGETISLNGAAGDDRFDLADGVGVDSIDGGAHGASGDFLDMGNFLAPSGAITFTANGIDQGTATVGAITITYSGVERLAAGANGGDTLDPGAAASVAYTVTGADQGTTSLLTGSAPSWQGIENLAGTAGNDTLTFSGATASLAGTFTGNGGSDAIAGSTAALAFEIGGGVGDGADDGRVTANGIAATFLDVSDLTGSSAADSFTINGGTLSGTADGAGGAGDSLVGDLDYTVSGANTGSSTSVSAWQNIENLTGSGAGNLFTFDGATAALAGAIDGAGGIDTITGTTAVLAFDLRSDVGDGADDGRVTAGGVSTQFVDIANLTGSTANDSFTVSGGSLSGLADGAGGAGDRLLGDTAYTISGGDSGTSNAVAAWQNIENLTGSAGDDTFSVAGGTLSGTVDGLGGIDTLAGDANYTVNGANAGVSDAVNAWQNIESLTGTAGANLFTFSGATAGLGGVIDGAGGVDTLTGSASALAYDVRGDVGDGADDGRVTAGGLTADFLDIANLTGSSANDVFTVSGGSLSGLADGDGAGGAGDRLVGDSAYTISGADSGTSNAIATWQNIENLVGGAGSDQFDFVGGSLSGSADGSGGNDVFDVTADTTVTQLIGGAGNDTFNITNDAVLTGNILGGGGDDRANFGPPTGTPPGTDLARIVGDVDLGSGVGDNDLLDFSGSDLAQIVRAGDAGGNDQTGSITASGGGFDLISGQFDGVEDFTGNNKGTLIGPDTDTFWLITGTNTGSFGDSLASIAVNDFINFNVLAGSGADTVIFATGGPDIELDGGEPATPFLEVGFDGGSGVNVLVGSTGADLFAIEGADIVDYTNPGGGQTRLTNIDRIDSTAGGGAFTDVGDDTFALGTNTFAGGLVGGAGSDTLSALKAVTATIASIDASGMASGAGQNNLAGGGFAQMENLNTGAFDDTVTLLAAPTGARVSINLDGDSGSGARDTLRTSFATTWVIAGPADGAGVVRGLPGSATDQVAFSGVENLTATQASALALPVTAGNAASVEGNISAPAITLLGERNFVGTAGLRLLGPVSRSGNLLIDADGSGDILVRGTLDVSGNLASVVAAGLARYDGAVTTGGSQSYTGRSTFRGNLAGGSLRFDAIDILADVTMTSTTGVFDFNGGVASPTGVVLNLLPPAGTDLFVDAVDGVGHISHTAFADFDGTLVLGGALVPAAPGGTLLDGLLVAATADYVRVSRDFATGGNLLVVGTALEFAAATDGGALEVTAGGPGGGEFAFFALGQEARLRPATVFDGLADGTEPGNITGPARGTVTFTGGRATFAATNEVLNTDNIIMNLARGEVAVAQSDTAAVQQVTFNVRSNATDSAISIPDSALAASIAELLGLPNASSLFQNVRVSFPNPAAVLSVLQAVAFVDASLFEEDLSLFGVIGNGIALSLDQCEDAEGCAPSVTAAELATLIEGLEARITELEKLVAERRIEADEGRRLLDGYREQLVRFLDYQGELQAYLEAQEAEQFGDDFEDEFEETFGEEFEDGFDDVIEAEEVLEPADEAAGEAPAEAFEPLEEDAGELFAPLEPALEEPDDFEEAGEEAEPLAPPAEATEAPFEDPAFEEPAFEELDEFDGFEELEEEIEGFELNDLGAPGSAAGLAANVRIGPDGAVEWLGEVVLPTLHRRF
ncbi:MAG: hypothetical protein RLW42_02740 [Gammaproteobacteria bacterium]